MLRALLVVLVLAGVCSGAPLYTVEMVQVVHRHGARSPLVGYNETQLCGLTYPCGVLNQQGQMMLTNLGSFLRHRYNEDGDVVAGPMFPQSSYNLTISTSRSTDVLRTLQSSDAFLRGMFPEMEAYYPAIHTIAKADDVLLRSSVIPEVKAKYRYGAAEESRLCDPLVDALFPNLSELQAAAAEVYSAGYCADQTTRTKCAMQLCDIGRAYQSLGTLPLFPKLNQHLAAVCEVLSCSSRYIFGYDPKNEMDVARGSLGQPLAQQMIENIYRHLQAPTFQLYEYSAHDTTISPLAVTFGDSRGIMMEVPFASTFILELLTRGGSKYVRLLFGHAGQTPETHFAFAFTDFELRCMRDGKTYVAEDNVCPLEDFVAFVNSTKPHDTRGLCIVDAPLLDQMRCGPSVRATEISDDCRQYRQRCPTEACGKDFTVTHDDECVRLVSSSSGVSGLTVFFIVVVAFVAGASALYFTPVAIAWWKRRKRSADEEPVVL